MSSKLQTDIEERLATAEPSVDVLLAEEAPRGTVRLFIDHPDGVTLDVCERVTKALAELRERYTLEVSSPGPERPLSKPEHFRRFLGRRARVRTRRPLECGTDADSASSFTGELVGASDSDITVAAPNGVVSIPYAEIRRSNLVGD
jgi:ribosome maturation factor RimP